MEEKKVIEKKEENTFRTTRILKISFLSPLKKFVHTEASDIGIHLTYNLNEPMKLHPKK